jgi:hypothetical protein
MWEPVGEGLPAGGGWCWRRRGEGRETGEGLFAGAAGVELVGGKAADEVGGGADGLVHGGAPL